MATTRPQFVRSNVPGAIPGLLSPGSFAINWPDRKLYVGDGGGNPLLFSHHIYDWQLGSAYAEGDFVAKEGDLLRARQAIPANTPFSAGQWTAYTANATSQYAAPTETGLLSGGVLSAPGGAVLGVTAGTGVVVSSADLTAVGYTRVEWAAFTLDVTMTGSPQYLAVTMNDAGVLQVRPEAAVTAAERRRVIYLGAIHTDATTITAVVNAPLPAFQSAEALRDEYAANGGPYKVSGLLLSPAGTDLTLQATSGYVFALGSAFRATPTAPNLTLQAARDPLQFSVVAASGVVAASADAIDPTVWESGGSPAAVPATKVTIQYVFQRVGGEVVVQIGQTLYDNITDALLSLGFDYEDFVPAPQATAQTVLGAVVVTAEATNLANSSHAYIASALAGRGFPFPRQYQSPDQDLSGFYKLDGTRPLTGNLDGDGHALTDVVIDGGVYS